MNHQVRFTQDAEDDLHQLYDFILDRDPPDWSLAERALDAIRAGVAALAFSPYACRKAARGMPFLRELLIPFGATGYVVLFEIEPHKVVTVLAVRHQREDDYH